MIAGRLGGRRLTVPAGRSVRPTSDRVREALFSMLGSVDDAIALDLFAGSGALAIETLSRGARSAVLVERDRAALAAIEANLEALGLCGATVHRGEALAYLRGAETTFDLIFVDPPYSSAPRLAAPLSEAIPAVAAPDALIVTESDKRNPLELSLPLVRERTYGDTRIALHRGS